MLISDGTTINILSLQYVCFQDSTAVWHVAPEPRYAFVNGFSALSLEHLLKQANTATAVWSLHLLELHVMFTIELALALRPHSRLLRTKHQRWNCFNSPHHIHKNA